MAWLLCISLYLLFRDECINKEEVCAWVNPIFPNTVFPWKYSIKPWCVLKVYHLTPHEEEAFILSSSCTLLDGHTSYTSSQIQNALSKCVYGTKNSLLILGFIAKCREMIGKSKRGRESKRGRRRITREYILLLYYSYIYSYTRPYTPLYYYTTLE